MSRPRRADEDLRSASGHLWYEHQMFRATALALHIGFFPSGPVHDALLESFIIHGRNLLHFLYPDNAQVSDVIADDYLDDPAKWTQSRGDLPPALSNLRRRANKEVAHLTYDRLAVSEEAKRWHFIDILSELDAKLLEVRKLIPSHRVAEQWSLFEQQASHHDA